MLCILQPLAYRFGSTYILLPGSQLLCKKSKTQKTLCFEEGQAIRVEKPMEEHRGPGYVSETLNLTVQPMDAA